MGIEVRRDESRVLEVLEFMQDLQTRKIRVGITSEVEGDMLMIAKVHEFGCSIEVTDAMRAYLHRIGIHLRKDTRTIEIPERSFIRAGFDENQDGIQSRVAQLIEEVMDGTKDKEEAFRFMGEYCAGRLRDYINELSQPPLHPATIANRTENSTNPLIDHGHLRDAITYQID